MTSTTKSKITITATANANANAKTTTDHRLMMAGRKQQYLFYSNNNIDHTTTTTATDDEFDESDVWGCKDVDSDQLNSKISSFPTSRPRSKMKKKDIHRVSAASLPVNVPDWPKNRNGESELDDEDEYEMGCSGGGERGGIVPPHEYLWQQRRRSGVSSFSVHEGVGRTLKGRDLSRVRNAVWEKIGFQD